jgi:hypothetical protein
MHSIEKGRCVRYHWHSHCFANSQGALLTTQYSMISMVESNVSSNSTDGNHHRRHHHSFYFLREEIMVDYRTTHFQICVNHFDVTFLVVPESNIYGIHVASMATLEVPDPDLLPRTHRAFRQSIL